jgi:hypothetical protein
MNSSMVSRTALSAFRSRHSSRNHPAESSGRSSLQFLNSDFDLPGQSVIVGRHALQDLKRLSTGQFGDKFIHRFH